MPDTLDTFCVAVQQTTYWELHPIGSGATTRVNFRNRSEARFYKTNSCGPILITNRHPLLLDYLEPHTSVYFAARPGDVQALLSEVDAAVTDYTDGWRGASRYIPHKDAAAALDWGAGLFFEGPTPLAERVADMLTFQGARPSMLRRNGPQGTRELLLVGRSYVIAREMRIEPAL